MSRLIPHIPKADTLVGSMRSMGYSFHDAIADIIDNSISAHSTYVKLFLPRTSEEVMVVGILDDGDGMPKATLFEAMRYGSADCAEERDEQDLGRFGLGMKAASLSQCRVLTVVSKHGGEVNGYTWDFNIIQREKDWVIQELTPEEIYALPHSDKLSSLVHGTLVLWRDFDVLSKANKGMVFNALDNLKEPLSKYLGLVFHRYLKDASKNKFTIHINNGKVKALDPFLENHPKTTTKKERTIDIRDSKGVERLICIKPYVLPYITSLSDKDKQLLGGVEDLRLKQGFYVYRNRRLIIWGTWFNMHRRGELTKNVRIRVDIPNSLDDIWGINIMKKQAVIPDNIKHRMRKIVEEAMEISTTQQKHRGRRENTTTIDYIWDRMEGRDKTYYYQINRNSKVYQMILSKLSAEAAMYLDMLVSEIEKNIPIQQIYLDKSNNTICEEGVSDSRFEEVYQLGITMIDLAKTVNNSPTSQIIDSLMVAEPFCTVKNIREALLKYYDNETA